MKKVQVWSKYNYIIVTIILNHIHVSIMHIEIIWQPPGSWAEPFNYGEVQRYPSQTATHP